MTAARIVCASRCGVVELDPYKISGPALISFSGGRTSGMMLWKILEAHGGKLPDDMYVAFANTGKEHEETLRFVHECGSRWGVKIHWLEFITDLRRGGAASRFIEVGYNSASREGEPLERLIARKKAIFSTQSGRWCTEFCKVKVLADFMETFGYQQGEYAEVIGFRADERDRVIEMPNSPRNAARLFRFPLAESAVRKSDVFKFWEFQDFDLELERGLGNCDQCPFLSYKARVIRARRDTASVRWWADKEQAFNYNFGRESFAAILQDASQSALLPLDDIEQDAADSECVGWCGGSS